jgi:uncharacterized protein (TIGR02996 family)
MAEVSAADAFLRAILDNPDDDLPRLIYADWLDEHGDAARAEFIRVQIERARLSADDERQDALAAREKELLIRYGPEWGLPFELRGQVFRRGFVEAVTADTPQFLRRADAIFRQQPVSDLSLLDAARYNGPLAGCEHLRRIRCLKTEAGGLPGVVGALIGSRPPRRLQTLRLFNFHSTYTPRVLETDTDVFDGLTELEIVVERFTDEEASLLANTPHLAGLRSIRLRGGDAFDRPADRIQATGAAAIARSRYLTRLTTFDLAHNFIGDAGVAALADSPNLSHLTTLDLTDNDIGSSGDVAVQRLCESPYLTHLTTLDLRMNVIGRSSHRRLRARFGDVVLL